MNHVTKLNCDLILEHSNKEVRGEQESRLTKAGRFSVATFLPFSKHQIKKMDTKKGTIHYHKWMNIRLQQQCLG